MHVYGIFMGIVKARLLVRVSKLFPIIGGIDKKFILTEILYI